MDRRVKNRVSATAKSQLNQPKADEVNKPEWHPFQVWKTRVMRPESEAAAEEQEAETLTTLDKASSF